MKRLIGTLGAAGVLLAAPVAQAAPLITEWSYEVTLEWTDANFVAGADNGNPFGPGTTSQDADVISWGATGGDYTDNTQTGQNSRSALVITNDPANGTVLSDGVDIGATNTVTHYNNSISQSFDTLDTASALTTLTLTPFAPPAGGPLPTVEREYTVQFIETTNEEPCGFESTSICDDIFTIILGDLDFSFEYLGFLYTVTVLELSGNLGPLSDAQCAAAGAAAGCVGIITQEDTFTPINFGITILATPIPEPTVLALLGIGLVGLGAMRRKAS